MTLALWAQATLLVFYVVLTVLFALDRKTWPTALYYAGCVVKDAGVMVLTLIAIRLLEN
jgi:hypothetical protein